MAARQRAAAAPVAMADLIAFLRRRLDEVPRLDWHDVGGCAGVPGPAGSCCEARAMALRQAQTIRQRLDRYDRALAESQKGPLKTSFWHGAMTALWVEVRADAALWWRHAEYRPEWKDPAASGAAVNRRAEAP